MMGLSVTVDVDGEAGLPDGGRAYGDRLTSRSERLYGPRRGVQRILAVLEEFDAEATFYVPGITALRHPDVVRAIRDAGHEIGHHGHRHLRTDQLDARGEREEIEAALEALARVGDLRPTSYRSPGWELTPVTLALIGRLGFEVDSSLMEDDRPYRLPAGDRALIELPVAWSLDDAPHFARGGGAEELAAVWSSELRSAMHEQRHVTYTMHPEIIGRPHRLVVLRELLGAAAEGGVRSRSHREVAARLVTG